MDWTPSNDVLYCLHAVILVSCLDLSSLRRPCLVIRKVLPSLSTSTRLIMYNNCLLAFWNLPLAWKKVCLLFFSFSFDLLGCVCAFLMSNRTHSPPKGGRTNRKTQLSSSSPNLKVGCLRWREIAKWDQEALQDRKRGGKGVWWETELWEDKGMLKSFRLLLPFSYLYVCMFVCFWGGVTSFRKPAYS